MTMSSKLALPRATSTVLILAVSLFVALLSNQAFFATAARTYGLEGENLVFIGSLFVHISAIFILVLSALCHRRGVKPVLIVFLLLSSILAYFSNTYGTVFDHRMIGNILETQQAEAADLFNPKLLLYVALLGVLPSLVVYLMPIPDRDWKSETVARLKLVGGAAASLIAVHLAFAGNYASLMREHRAIPALVNPTYALYSTLKFTSRSMRAAGATHVEVGTDARIAALDPHRELVIMVVGETARADHWGLNGYARDTTPLLRQAGVVNFPDFWSCDTSTARSVPCMFSHLGRAGFSRDRAKAEDNALDVLKRAGVSVLWRDNNSSSKGVADRVAYEDFQASDKNPVCEPDGECRDEGMLAGLQDYIDKQPGDVLIVLHQMGNHGPAYYKRYPKAFERFTPVCKTNDLGACSSEEIDNAYDNAILYTDYVLSKVIELLKQNDGRFETAMLYVSDHGESLGEYGLYLHGMPYAIAPDVQKHVPAVMWLGRSIEHDLDLTGIEERRRRRWSHDNVFSTLLGLFEIDSTVYNPGLDLLLHVPEVADTPLGTSHPASSHY